MATEFVRKIRQITGKVEKLNKINFAECDLLSNGEDVYVVCGNEPTQITNMVKKVNVDEGLIITEKNGEVNLSIDYDIIKKNSNDTNDNFYYVYFDYDPNGGEYQLFVNGLLTNATITIANIDGDIYHKKITKETSSINEYCHEGWHKIKIYNDGNELVYINNILVGGGF